MIFYEAPHRLSRTLQDLLDAFGDREIALVKELTKIHEAVERTTLSAAAAKYAEQQVKGEYVLVIHGADTPDKPSPLPIGRYKQAHQKQKPPKRRLQKAD